MGRRRLFTLEQIQTTFKETDGTYNAVAEKLGVSKQTIYNFVSANPQLKELVSYQRAASGILKAISTRTNHGIIGDMETVLHLLELCEQRCANATEFGKAGVCCKGKECSEDCTLARQNAQGAKGLMVNLIEKAKKCPSFTQAKPLVSAKSESGNGNEPDESECVDKPTGKRNWVCYDRQVGKYIKAAAEDSRQLPG